MSAKDWWIENRTWIIKRKYGTHPAVTIQMLSWNRPLRISDMDKAISYLKEEGLSPDFLIIPPEALPDVN